MGLDSVEIIMEIEQTFGIAIPDAEAEKIITVGDLLQVVQSKLQHQSVDGCLHQIVFFRLRKALKEQLFSEAHISLETDLNALMPKTDKRLAYEQLKATTRFELPALQLPNPYKSWFRYAVLATLLFNAALLAIWIFSDDSKYQSWYYTGIGVILFMLVLNVLITTFKTCIPAKSIRLFVQDIIQLNSGMLIQSHGINQQAVSEIVYTILMDKIGCSKEELAPEAKLVDDLGIN